MSASVNTFSGFDSTGQHGNHKMPGTAEFNGHVAQPGNAEQEQSEPGNPRSQPIPQPTQGQPFQGAPTASLNLPTPVSQATPPQFSQTQQSVKSEVTSAPVSAANTATNVSAATVQSQASGNRPGPQAHFTISGRPILLTAGPGSSNIIGTAAVVEVTTNQFKNRVAFSDASEQPHYDVSAAGSQVTIIPSQQVSANFSYNDSGMYSQPTTVPTYIEASPHHPPPQNAGMYQSYPNQTNSSLSTPSTTVGVNPQALGVAQQAYLQPQAVHQRVPISHTTRASPATVQWLLENYETAEGVSLPRSTLYNHYLRHCSDNKIDAVNAASFGKLIRSVFLGLKTRRLGTRGNSKYHYYGIRVKPNSPLARLTDDTQVAMRQQPNPQKSRFKIPSRYDEDPQSQQSNATSSSEQSATQQQQLQHHQQYLGDTSEGLADLPAIEIISPLPEGITEDDVIAFTEMYRDHCEALLEVAISLQFPLVEVLWQTFWKSPAAPPNSDRNEESSVDSGSDRLPKSTLVGVSMYPAVQEFVRDSDYVLYQKLVEILVPDVLRAVPSSLTQTIRNFAKSLENWLMNSMSEMPKEIVNIKLSAVSAFSQTLRRYTSLNHLAQAARAVLQNPQQINQMWSDLNKVDFSNVQEQASWVCQCDEASVQKLEQDFKQTLARQQTLEQWAEWLERVVNNVLEPHRGLDSFPKAARQFLLKWSFYSSMIIRDLTLRSAASFGSFHLIRLLYDEYMFYLVEHKVAAATGKSPLAVMAEFVGLGHYNSSSDCSVEFGDPEKMSLLAGDATYRNGANRSPDLKRESTSLLFEDTGVKRPRDS